MYVPTLVRMAPGPGGMTSITMVLPDSGNLLAHAAIDAKFHQQLGVPVEATDIKARAANKQSLEILGISKENYIRFPNVNKTFFVKPLIVRNLSCKLNLGAQFNHQTGFIPLKVSQTTPVREQTSASWTASASACNSRTCQIEHCEVMWETQSLCSSCKRNLRHRGGA